jgi:hypothetical protein
VINDAARAAYWRDFILTRCSFPAPGRLRRQFACATFAEFCACGCSSFAVHVSPEARVQPIARPGGHGGLVFDAWVQLDEERTLEIGLLCDQSGNLAFVEITCCANSFPVPDEVADDVRSFHVWSSPSLLSDDGKNEDVRERS